MDVKDLFGLTGRNVAITGSASGMSRAATEMLIALGANVYAVDIADIDLPVTAAFKADMSDKEQVDAWLASLPEEIEAVFLCHGIAGKPGIWHKMFQINFISQKYVAERLLPRIAEGGSVTFISSMGGLGWQRMYADLQGLIEAEGWEGQEAWYEAHVDLVDGDPNPYAVSKKALNSYVTKKCMDPAYVAKHIRVNTICPGMTNTGLTNAFNTGAGGGDAEAGRKALDATFTAVWGGQNATPEQMGYPLVVLGSQISSYISGVNLFIDHGVSAWWESNGILGEGPAGVF